MSEMKLMSKCSYSVSCQEVVLSPVQDGDNKPQIDSNKANNYNIVKEVSSMS